MDVISTIGEAWGWKLVVLVIGMTALFLLRHPLSEVLRRLASARVPGGTEMTFSPPGSAPEDPEVVARRDAKLDEIARRLEGELAEVQARQTDTGEKLRETMAVVRDALDVTVTVEEEAQEEALSKRIVGVLDTTLAPMSVYDIGNALKLLGLDLPGWWPVTQALHALHERQTVFIPDLRLRGELSLRSLVYLKRPDGPVPPPLDLEDGAKGGER